MRHLRDGARVRGEQKCTRTRAGPDSVRSPRRSAGQCKGAGELTGRRRRGGRSLRPPVPYERAVFLFVLSAG